MFVILFYDFREDRSAKALKICRKYLKWVQNSVFEGEITEVNLRRLKQEISDKMVKETDSLIIYRFNSMKYSSREVVGIEKNPESIFL